MAWLLRIRPILEWVGQSVEEGLMCLADSGAWRGGRLLGDLVARRSDSVGIADERAAQRRDGLLIEDGAEVGVEAVDQRYAGWDLDGGDVRVADLVEQLDAAAD